MFGKMSKPAKVDDKLLHYETYINNVLKEDLKKIDQHLQRVNSEIVEFSQIKHTLELLQNTSDFPDGFKTQVDVGCNFFIEAKVTDTSSMLFDIGLNHFLEFTKEESEKFVELRIKALEKMSTDLRQKSAETKAHIKLMLFGIGQLQNLHTESKS